MRISHPCTSLRAFSSIVVASKVHAVAGSIPFAMDPSAPAVKPSSTWPWSLFRSSPSTHTPNTAHTAASPSPPSPSTTSQPPPQTPRVTFPIAVYSHRGGPLEAPGFIENTLPAFRNSAQLQVDLLELDVQLTLDGQVVVFHDRDLGRMFGPAYKGRRIRDFTYEQLPTFPSPAGGAQASSGAAVAIPLLKEVFEEFPTFPVQVDIKVPTPGLVKATHQLIMQHQGRRERTLWGSFVGQVNAELYATDPGIPLFTSATRALYLMGAHKMGMLSRTRIHESAAIIPWRIPTGWGHHLPFLSSSFFKALNDRGVAVVVYGERDAFNTEEAFRLARDAGANAICTDAPSLLQRFLQREGPLKPLPHA